MIELVSRIPTEVIDAVGVAGFGLYVTNYVLLTAGRLRSEYITYFALNWCAATMVLIGLTASFNLASALIQVFWIGISTVGIAMRLKRGRASAIVSVNLPDKPSFQTRRAA